MQSRVGQDQGHQGSGMGKPTSLASCRQPNTNGRLKERHPCLLSVLTTSHLQKYPFYHLIRIPPRYLISYQQFLCRYIPKIFTASCSATRNAHRPLLDPTGLYLGRGFFLPHGGWVTPCWLRGMFYVRMKQTSRPRWSGADISPVQRPILCRAWGLQQILLHSLDSLK